VTFPLEAAVSRCYAASRRACGPSARELRDSYRSSGAALGACCARALRFAVSAAQRIAACDNVIGDLESQLHKVSERRSKYIKERLAYWQGLRG
jgi:hypothetical protein